MDRFIVAFAFMFIAVMGFASGYALGYLKAKMLFLSAMTDATLDVFKKVVTNMEEGTNNDEREPEPPRRRNTSAN